MYRTKRNNDPLYNLNTNEAITYDFYNEQDVYMCGFNRFTYCRPRLADHKMELQIEWYGNSFFSEPDLNLNSDIYRYVRIGLKNTSNLTNSRIFFITDTDREWNDAKSVAFTLRPKDKLHYVYTVNMAENPLWRGKIAQLKFCPIDYPAWSLAKGNFGDFGVTLSYSFIQLASEALNKDAMVFNFKYDLEGFKAFGGAARVTEYMLYADAPQGGFFLESPEGLRLDGSVNKLLRIRQRCKSASRTGEIYYITEQDRRYGADKCLHYELKCDDAFVEYTVDTSSIEDKIWQVRFYPLGEGAGECEIDYIVFDTVEANDIEIPLCGTVDCSVRDACIGAEGFSADAALYKYVKIRMKNSTLSYNACIEWITEDDRVFDERKRQRFIIRPEDDRVREYTIGLNQNQYWRGRVMGIRLVPAAETPAVGASVIVESGAICRDGDTLTQNRNIVEGYLEEKGGNFPAGWVYDRAGGDILGYCCPPNGWITAGNLEKDNTKRCGKMTVICEGNGKRVGLYRRLVKQSEGVVDWRFAFQMDKPQAKGMTFSLKNNSGKDSVLDLTVEDGRLCADGMPVSEIVPFEWVDVRVMLDIDKGVYTAHVNGAEVCCAPLKVKEFDTVDIFATGEEELSCSVDISIYKVGYLYEDLDGCDLFRESGGAEKHLEFVRKAKGIVDCETSFIISDARAEAHIGISAGDTAAVGININDGNIITTDNEGREIVLWEGYRANVWYTAVITVNTLLQTATFTVNGQVRADNVKIGIGDRALTEFFVSASEAVIRLKAVRVKPHIYSTVPYFDTVKSRSGLVGMQAWFVLGDMWNRVFSQYHFSDKTPYLGFYDEMNIEAVEWQAKYLAEHGVDFITPFLYCDLDKPIYSSNNMVSTFLNYSEHKDDMKFCITMGELFQKMTREKMINNVLPYLIENYFKHPCYLKIDNKPVLLAYCWQTITDHLTPDGASALLGEMRCQMKKEGFDGLIMLGEQRPGLDGNIKANESFEKSGLDRIFAYCNIYTPEASKRYFESTREKGVKGTMCMGCGWDDRYWARGYFIINCTPAEFEAGIRWMGERPESKERLDDLVLLENWCEYGEGHSICPSNLYGFGYLNAIRKVFTDADEAHYDTVPEGAYNALNVTGTYPDCEPLDHVPCKRLRMPAEYEKKHIIQM